MKRFIFLLLISLPLSLSAQETPNSTSSEDFSRPRGIIKISPLKFFISTFEIGVEAFNADFNRSFNIDLGFRSGNIEYEDGRGGSLEIGYRKYVTPMKLRERKTRRFYQGIYYSPSFHVGYFEGTDEYAYDPMGGVIYSNQEKITSFAPSFTLGLQKTLWEIIYLDVYIGGGIRFARINRTGTNNYNEYYNDGLFQPGYEGIFPKIGLKIGVGL